jgi:hypothetical protein
MACFDAVTVELRRKCSPLLMFRLFRVLPRARSRARARPHRGFECKHTFISQTPNHHETAETPVTTTTYAVTVVKQG